MPAPKGNQYYKIRTRDGREKIFKTPNQLVIAANKYFDYCLENPLIEIDFKGKDAKEVKLPKMRAFSLEGLCNFIEIGMTTFKAYEKREDFQLVTTRIRSIIDSQQFEGAASGFLNPNIIARKLGLVDKSEIDHGDLPPTSIHITMDQVPPGMELPSSEDQVDLTRGK